ncbi:TlpA family protein disulfide reductase [Runella sp.]|uniref:TlpA family protein disulfide reductase n=1 Tax=Runella sp. TaxID=1960881 RepID=UPI003D14097D
MTKIIAFARILPVIFPLFAFTQTSLSAHLSSFPSMDYRIVHQQTMLNAYHGDLLAEGRSDTNGQLSASFALSGEQPALLFIGNQFFKIWLTPQTTLHIKEIDGQFDFIGATADHNRFLFTTGLMRPYTVNPLVNSDQFQPVQHIAYLNQLEQQRWQTYRTAFATQKVSSAFRSFVTGEISGFTFLQKHQYPQRFVYMNKTLREEDISRDYYNFWQGFQLANDTISSDIYHQSLQAFLEFSAKSKLGHSPKLSELYQAEFRLMDSLLKDKPLTHQRQKAEAIRFLIQYTDLNDLSQQAISALYNDFPHSPYAAFLEREWRKKNDAKLIVPSFQLRDSQGNLVDSKSLKGKLVYIDFWGSWCQPCMALMPSSEKLQQKFKNQPIVFLFINFHDSEEKWLKTVRDKHLSGLHLKAEKENESYFQKVFGIDQGFPRYALLDRDGKLQTTSAPRPDAKEIIPYLEHLLRKN